MTTKRTSTPTRRTLLATLGAGTTVGLIGAKATAAQEAASGYVLVQGDTCVPVRPIRGEETIRSFYDYQLPDRYVSEENGAFVGDTSYASAGTTDLQRTQTSIAFLYQAPQGLGLVVVHGSVEASDAGSVTFRVSGLPEDGEWLVKDDLYRDPETGELESHNYDRWDVDGTSHRIDWTWGSAGTDGGAFGHLGDDFEVIVDPAFNEAAPLYNEHYEGRVANWEFISSNADGLERISLDMDQPIRIATGSCEEGGQSDGDDQREVTDQLAECGIGPDDLSERVFDLLVAAAEAGNVSTFEGPVNDNVERRERSVLFVRAPVGGNVTAGENSVVIVCGADISGNIDVPNVVAKDTHVSGNIDAEQTVRVFGDVSVEGNVPSGGTADRTVIASESSLSVNGNVGATDVTLAARSHVSVTGNVDSARQEIRDDAELIVNGNLDCSADSIASTARIVVRGNNTCN